MNNMPLVNGWDTIKDCFKLWFGKSRTLIVKAELKKNILSVQKHVLLRQFTAYKHYCNDSVSKRNLHSVYRNR